MLHSYCACPLYHACMSSSMCSLLRVQIHWPVATVAYAQSLMASSPLRVQTAASVVQHLALGVAGLGCEDVLAHLLNYVWPNVFEDSPHVTNAVSGAVDGMRLSLGPAVVMYYTLQVREQRLLACLVC